MSEFVTIQVGQCGNQIGSVFWPQVLKEYGIQSVNANHPPTSSSSSLQTKLDKSFSSFFSCPEKVPKACQSVADLRKSKITARAILIDMEEKVVERFQHGSLRHLFDKRCLLTNHPGSGNNWAVGHHSHYSEHQAALADMVRRAAEQCDSLQGWLVLLSLGGGTGAGLGTAVVHMLQEHFPRVHRIVTCVHPGQHNDVVTSPYNVALSLRVLTECATCVIPVDNKALGDICIRNRLVTGAKPFEDVNNIVVSMLLNLTSGSRFRGSLNCCVSDLPTLVPRPGLHFLSASLAPLDQHLPRIHRGSRDLLQEVCSRDNQLMRVNSLGGQLLSAALMCRGHVSLSTLRGYVTRFQSKGKFAAWSEPGMKAGLCAVPPLGHASGLLCLCNSTSMSSLFSDTLTHFNLLYRRKAHVHHYTKIDGFEAEDFSLTQESLAASALNYSTATECLQVPRLNNHSV